MKVNMLEAKSQLSRLVEAALAGEEVLIARDGEPKVRLVPVAQNAGLSGFGSLRGRVRRVDTAFSPEAEAATRSELEGRG